jgi:hypothetical protein
MDSSSDRCQRPGVMLLDGQLRACAQWIRDRKTLDWCVDRLLRKNRAWPREGVLRAIAFYLRLNSKTLQASRSDAAEDCPGIAP